MSKTNNTEKTRELTEDELNHVSGGSEPVGLMHGDFSNCVTNVSTTPWAQGFAAG